MLSRSFLGHWAWCVLGVVSACQHAGAGPDAVRSPSDTRAATTLDAPNERFAPVASTPSTEPATPSATADVRETSPFIDGVRLGYAAQLDIVGKSALLTTEKLLLAIQGDRVAVDPALLVGLHPGISRFPRVFGNLPDAAWAVEVSSAERTTRSSLSRFTGSDWQNADALLRASDPGGEIGRSVVGISAWSGGRTLALIDNEYTHQLNFVQLAGPRGVPLPQLEYAAKNDFGCVHGMQPMAMSALPSGEVFLAGSRCTVAADDEVTSSGVVVERWGAGRARGKLDVLPGLEPGVAWAELTSFFAASAHDVFIAGVRTPIAADGSNAADEAYIAHFDGKAWHAVLAPPTDRIDDLQPAPDGKLWALCKGVLWATSSTASETSTWARVTMPRFVKEEDATVMSLWVQDTGAVWITLGSDDYSYLLRTRRGAAPLSAPPDSELAELTKSLDPSAAGDCENPTLVLLALSRDAPRDADMPSVRAALRGHPELVGKAQFVELPFLTRRYLVARGDRDALGLVMEALSEVSIPGLSPELRCMNGEPTRTLQLDFSGHKPTLPKRPRVVLSRPSREQTVPRDPATEIEF